MSASEVEPTLTADEVHAGALMEVFDPSFPLAATLAMPTERRLSMAGLYGCSSSQVDENRPSPTLRFTAANTCSSRSR